MTRVMRNLILLFISVCRLHSTLMTPSASQWPNPLLSTASGGRSEMSTRPGTGSATSSCRHVCGAVCALAAGTLLPVLGFHGTVLVFLAVLVASAVLMICSRSIRSIPKAAQWEHTMLQ